MPQQVDAELVVRALDRESTEITASSQPPPAVVAVVAAGDRSRPPEAIGLIRDMAARRRLWGADRIRSELLKLGIRVSKRTVHVDYRRAA